MEALQDKVINEYSVNGQLKADTELTLDQTKLKNKTRQKEKRKELVRSIQKSYILGAVFLSFFLIIYMALSYTEMVALESKVKVTSNENTDILLAIDTLELQIKPYLNERRIEQIALKRLGMVYPNENQIVKLNKPIEDMTASDLNETSPNTNSLLSFISSIFE